MIDTSASSMEELGKQRDWLHFTLSSIGDAVIATDNHGLVTFMNPVAESLTGRKSAEGLGRQIAQVLQLIDDATREGMQNTVQRVLQDGCACKLPPLCALVAKDGVERPIGGSAAPIRGGEGEFSGVVLVFRDVAELRQTENALAKALAYANDIIATMREPFLVLDADLRVKTANRSFYDMFHVLKNQTENRFLYDLGNGQWDIHGLRKLLDEILLRKNSIHDFEVEHSFPVLGQRTILLNARPFPPDSDRPELILLAVQDISAEREQSNEQAASIRNKDEFLATLAHELRNPLAPIRNAVHSLGLASQSAEGAKAARDVIDRQVATLVRLVDDLLDISRINRAKMEVRKRRVDLATVMLSAVESSRPGIEKCSHEISVSLPPQPLHLEADLMRLAQAFSNLLDNAAKFTKPGGHIRLGAQREGDEVVVRVRDDGIGIPADKLERIFEPFTQLKQASERSQGGLGIGLALARRLVEMHGGTVKAKSDGIDRGSEFVIRLPLNHPALKALPVSNGPS